MPWVISFIASWIAFFLLVEFKKIKTYFWGGTIALILASFVDWGGQKLQFYTFSNLIIPWFGCSAFYKFGPIFTMGILFCQYVPKNKWIQSLNIIIFSLIFLSLEYLIIQTRVAKYIHWHILASLTIDLLVFIGLTWFTTTFLRNNEKNS